MTKPKPKPKTKKKPPPPPKRARGAPPVTDDPQTTRDTATEPVRHTRPGTIKSTAPMEGDPPPESPKDDAPEPPPPPGLKPNDLVAMPPGSVKAPSSFPGNTPPVDVVIPEPPTDEEEQK